MLDGGIYYFYYYIYYYYNFYYYYYCYCYYYYYCRHRMSSAHNSIVLQVVQSIVY